MSSQVQKEGWGECAIPPKPPVICSGPPLQPRCESQTGGLGVWGEAGGVYAAPPKARFPQPFTRLAVASLLALAGCGDLPQPFAGRPGATALRLANPPPARLTVPTPGGALLPPKEASLMAHDLTDALVAQELPAFPEQPRAGDWQIRVSAELQGSTVIPRYELLDAGMRPKGGFTGAPLSAAAWAAGDPAIYQQAAATAAPQITALLRSVDASIKQSDPNSLYNRPARIFVAGVTGAPGDGNLALSRQMRAKLPDTGDVLATSAAGADFIVRGTVHIAQLAGRQQQVEIHWLVYDTQGKEAGDIAQGHDIDQGSLDHYWGDVASAVADEAAPGVHEVITNWSGRKKTVEHDRTTRSPAVF